MARHLRFPLAPSRILVASGVHFVDTGHRLLMIPVAPEAPGAVARQFPVRPLYAKRANFGGGALRCRYWQRLAVTIRSARRPVLCDQSHLGHADVVAS
jgi:hypothetical protein